jgi:hypothetical protein
LVHPHKKGTKVERRKIEEMNQFEFFEKFKIVDKPECFYPKIKNKLVLKFI